MGKNFYVLMERQSLLMEKLCVLLWIKQNLLLLHQKS